MNESNQTGVSVVTCCHNSSSRLPETLKHLASQSLTTSLAWEVIVVNNASSDETSRVAAHLWSEYGSPAPMRVVDEPTPGLSHARERGIASARYDTLVFVDDDNWLNGNYLSVAYDIMQAHPDIGALGGHITAAFEVEPPTWFGEMQSWYAVGPQGRESGDITEYKPHVAGAGMVLRKTAYEELKRRRFAFILADRTQLQLTSGGDTELCAALVLAGYRVWYDEGLRMRHFIPRARLTKAYLRRMIEDSAAAGNVMALYKLALAGRSGGIFSYVAGEVTSRGWWSLKTATKVLLGRCSLFALEMEVTQLFRRLTALPKLSSLHQQHLETVQRLAKP